MLDSCDLNYIYDPLSTYRRQIFRHIHTYVPEQAGRLLDLGCGAVGFYWALAYLERVENVTFADQHAEIIRILAERIDLLSPSTIENEFADTIAFLQNEGVFSQDFSTADWLQNFHGRLAGVRQVDALRGGSLDEKVDSILAIEFFDCANSEEELTKLLCFCSDKISQNGRLIGNVLNYREWSDSLDLLAGERLIGRLNPTQEQLEQVIGKSAFQIECLVQKETGMANFPSSIFFCLRK